jgi:5'-methylthioadenosine phosphorylase
VIGGSGIYDLDALTDVEEVAVATPFGDPSDVYITGRLADTQGDTQGNTKMVFLPRHGRGHRILPHEINYRANIYGMKTLGVEWLISLSAVGSMKQEIRPGDMVIIDQLIDWTRRRVSTFFGDGIAAHVAFGDPISMALADILYDAAREEVAAGGGDERVHKGGTYIVMDGPQFSTRGESNLYRSWGVDVIGMTNMPEAKLAREAEISYATIALATDYDCWHESEQHVSVEAVIAIVRKNADLARKIVARAVSRIPAARDCPAATALENAIMTDPDSIPAEVKTRLAPIIGKYL